MTTLRPYKHTARRWDNLTNRVEFGVWAVVQLLNQRLGRADRLQMGTYLFQSQL